MNYILTKHAQDRLRQRNITGEELDRTIQNPQQVIAQEDGTNAYQSLVVKEGRILMLRAFVDDRVDPAKVISVYITTDARYWSAE